MSACRADVSAEKSQRDFFDGIWAVCMHSPICLIKVTDVLTFGGKLYIIKIISDTCRKKYERFEIS